ncbi:hypothetical protein HRW23_35960, partial [Streptomyces lunaelactis]|nr:hypothetical protein [Streptomyces lunaelactis]
MQHDQQGDGSPMTQGGRRPHRLRLILISSGLALTLAGGGAAAYKYGLFSDIGDPVSFDKVQEKAARASDVPPEVRMPTGPAAEFVRTHRLPDGTQIGKTTLVGKKSGFTGDVW